MLTKVVVFSFIQDQLICLIIQQVFIECLCQVLLGTWDTEMKNMPCFQENYGLVGRQTSRQLKYNVIDSLIKKNIKPDGIREAENLAQAEGLSQDVKLNLLWIFPRDVT